MQSDGPPTSNRAPRILVVCTANICRSPMAEGFLVAMDPGLEVRSGGFLEAGRPAAPDAVRVMGEHGVDIADHRSSVVGDDDLIWADVVLTMERRHARDLVVLAPAARGRIFTMGSFVQRAQNRPAGSLPALLAALDAHRSTSDLLGSGRDEVADPYGRSFRSFRSAADELRTLSDAVVRILDGRSPGA